MSNSNAPVEKLETVAKAYVTPSGMRCDWDDSYRFVKQTSAELVTRSQAEFFLGTKNLKIRDLEAIIAEKDERIASLTNSLDGTELLRNLALDRAEAAEAKLAAKDKVIEGLKARIKLLEKGDSFYSFC